MNKINIIVDVKGPGMVVTTEGYLLYQLLKEHGYEIEINDSHLPPADDFDQETFDPRESHPDLIGDKKIILNIQHLPWGG